MPDFSDRTMPQAPDVERAVIGAMFLDREAIGEAIEELSKEKSSFYKPSHNIIFRAITDLYDNNEPVDQLSVIEYLKKKGELDAAGGEYAIAALTVESTSSANIKYHCQILKEKALLRNIISISSLVQNRCFDETADPDEILNRLETDMMNISLMREIKDYTMIKDVIHDVFKDIEKKAETKDGIVGTPSGFRQLDRLTSGWQNSNLIILAGRPSMGKTALALDFAKNAASKDIPVGIFSLEMSVPELVKRLIYNEGRFDASTLYKRKPENNEWIRLSDACARLAKFPIYIDDTPGLSTIELSAKAKRLKKERNIGVLFVDYLQLMQGTNRESRQQEISSISRALKMLAKELEIPVMALSQLSRAVEQRGGDHKPVLSDLRESGAIEQDADVVMFIYRASVYDSEPTYNIDDHNVDPSDVAEIIVRKQRNGPTGTVLLHWIKDYMKFGDFDYESTDEFF